jgi:hypothetical protein
MVIKEPLCFWCKHFTGRGEVWVCNAFPSGIPMDIVNGDFEHTKPHAGDHDIQYDAEDK